MKVGRKIIQFREAKGISTTELAHRAGIAQSALRDIELGIKNPRISTVKKICSALGISLSDFFADESMGSILEDPLYKAVFKLDEKQRKALLQFIHSITH